MTMIEETVSREEFDAFKEKVRVKALEMVDKGNWCLQGVEQALRELGIEDNWAPDPGRGHYVYCGATGYLTGFVRGASYWETTKRGENILGKKDGSWYDVVAAFKREGHHSSSLHIVKLFD